ncbi:MAG: hypothetical protein H6736_09970 [Alphaproteobacteria bacterium]|nr:hypothetical protein [Alphaproteobacteria bacterium]MCB9692127.1 hypothetical protein [Alphaproteobacteria bacterium]
MSEQRPPELRIVEDEEGQYACLYDQAASSRQSWIAVVGGQLIAALAGAPLVLAGGEAWLPGAFVAYLLVTLGLLVALSFKVHTRLEVRPRALHLTRQRLRTANPTREQARSGAHASLTLGPDIPERIVPWSDITRLGHDDHAVWFELEDGQREELVLDGHARADVLRLYDLLAPMWERARESLTDDAEQARQARARLESVRQ